MDLDQHIIEALIKALLGVLSVDQSSHDRGCS